MAAFSKLIAGFELLILVSILSGKVFETEIIKERVYRYMAHSGGTTS